MGGFAKELQDREEDSKHKVTPVSLQSSAKISPTRDQDSQSSLLPEAWPVLYLTYEQDSAMASLWHHGPFTWNSAGDPGPPSNCTGRTGSQCRREAAPGICHLVESYYTCDISTWYSHLQPSTPISWPDKGGLTHWGKKKHTKMGASSCPRDKTGS